MQRTTLAILAMVAFGVSACAPNPATSDALEDVCRPSDVMPATLGIGALEVPHDRLVAQLQSSAVNADYGISIRLSQEHAEALARLTRENLNTPIPLRLDDVVLAEPIVRTPILDGRILIAGNFTRSAASDVVARLSSACIPAAVNDAGTGDTEAENTATP